MGRLTALLRHQRYCGAVDFGSEEVRPGMSGSENVSPQYAIEYATAYNPSASTASFNAGLECRKAAGGRLAA